VFKAWLKTSRLLPQDMLFILSVIGGRLEKNVSPNLVRAIEYARAIGAQVIGIVGGEGGYTAQVADACVIIPRVNEEMITPHTEALHSVIWHLLVWHPLLKANPTNNNRY
jgi:D-sedoheptulose 7-phosphate isomerase